MNLSDVYVFKRLAKTLSFTEAARQIGVSRSTVSKQLSRLEQDLGVVLVNRTTRSVSLTESGRVFDESTGDIDRTIERAADLVRGADRSPQGTVSFTIPTPLGAAFLPALVTRFQTHWPDLKLDMQCEDQVRDLHTGNLDLAVRISKKLRDSNLIARRLLKTTKVLAASPVYLDDHGTPVDPASLKEHRCLGLGSAVRTTATWTFEGTKCNVDVPLNLAMSSNNCLSLILAACLDAGIIFVPEVCIAGELARGDLQIIPGFTCPDPYGVYVVYPHRNAPAKVKVLVEFIEEMLDNIDRADRRALQFGHRRQSAANGDSDHCTKFNVV